MIEMRLWNTILSFKFTTLKQYKTLGQNTQHTVTQLGTY